MAGVMRLILLFISLYSIFHPALSRKSSSNITWWCSKTPHPEPCVYYMRRSRQHFAPKHTSEFRQMVVQLAMERALNAKKHALQFRSSCETEHRKAAWSDCLKLYDNTVLQLNLTLQGIGANKSCTDFDAQTWLSAALTNIQTCGSGSMDLNVSDFINPIIMSNNLTQLLSNSLAINGVFVKQENTSYTGWFPSWLTRQERKLLQSSSLTFKAKANLVVAKDGSGNYKTIQAAINAAAEERDCKYTIITSSRSVKGGYTTYSSATAGIDGPGFIAWEITFRNGAGPSKGQAVALRSASDLSVFYRCAIQGYQDTLMVHSQRQFYRECYIYGTIDFIFGNAAVVFQNSLIYVRRPLKGQANVITAQGRNDPNQNTAITIHNSKILAASDLKPVVKAFKTYLGRPWQQYSRTVIVKTYLDSLVSPLGWSPWALNSEFALDTLYYGEYKNSGPGSSTRSRVKWKGFHVITSSATASRFTVGSLIAGRSWLPATGVPFTSGL
ncbi:hypothetical protein Patl1_19903 [Pistacia atlantica]|uniref:Uncharacterized protein n=1 Tax=Pistacia atlantica TaxID=434234 RepID=A0ACC1BLR6_9ROSI|nr:hypothetical protein Patl1_19903 [Pistacia atlantica]